MVWTHIKQSRELMLDEQWIYKTENAPACSLRHDDSVYTWQARILNRSGISTTVAHFEAITLLEAQEECEALMRRKGWRTTE